MSDASLGGVHMFGYPTEDDEKQSKLTLKRALTYCPVWKSMMTESRGKFNVLDSEMITRVCRPRMATEVRGLGMFIASLQFCVDFFREILGGQDGWTSSCGKCSVHGVFWA